MSALLYKFMNTARRLPGASLLLSFAALLLWLSPETSEWTQWDRAQPLELWRWFTGHLTHWSAEHLQWDLGAFLILGALCERRSRIQFLLCVVSSGLAIALAVALLLPEISSYRGLSGIDSALFAWVTTEALHVTSARRNKLGTGLLCLFALVFAAKVVIEFCTSNTLFVSQANSSFIPVPLAHAVGALTGAVINIFWRRTPFGNVASPVRHAHGSEAAANSASST